MIWSNLLAHAQKSFIADDDLESAAYEEQRLEKELDDRIVIIRPTFRYCQPFDIGKRFFLNLLSPFKNFVLFSASEWRKKEKEKGVEYKIVRGM